MNTNHIDQLAEWWETAEQGTPREGDTYIARFPGRDGYETGVVGRTGLPHGMLPDTRVLARAPKPAWRGAVAVTARCDDTPMRYALLRDGDRWINVNDEDFMGDDLEDVTPLIEAKVTDEMVHRAAAVFARARDDGHVKPFAAALTAALGLETE